MGFFAKFGIDWKLLLAQAVNFAILVWILRHFVYRPLLKGMEASELERAERDLAEVKKEREAFAKEREEKRAADRKRAAEVIGEAEKVADELSARIKEEARVEKEEELASFKERLTAQEAALAKTLPVQARRKIVTRLSALWKRRLGSADEVRDLQQDYLPALLKDVAGVKFDVGADAPDVTLTGAVKPRAAESAKVVAALADRLGREKIPLTAAADAALIAGYRLEVSGFVIERSLRTDIKDAVEKN